MGRPVSLGTRYTRIKNMLKGSLEEKGIYDPADDIILNELIYNIKIIDDCKQDIKKRGYQINTVKDKNKEPYYQANPSVSTYIKSVQVLSNLLTKLGITPQERAKLDLEKKEDDPLGMFLKKAEKTSIDN